MVRLSAAHARHLARFFDPATDPQDLNLRLAFAASLALPSAGHRISTTPVPSSAAPIQ
jgi:hypothetical protein